MARQVVQDVRIANGQALSDPVQLPTGAQLTGILMPAAWTAADLSLQVSFDGATWYNFFGWTRSVSEEQTLKVGANQAIVLLDREVYSWTPWIRFRSGTSAAAVNQGAERVLRAVITVAA